jgi:hypothetical protein
VTELSHHFVRNGILALEEQAPVRAEVLPEGGGAGWILSSLVSSMALKVGQQCAESSSYKVVCCVFQYFFCDVRIWKRAHADTFLVEFNYPGFENTLTDTSLFTSCRRRM